MQGLKNLIGNSETIFNLLSEDGDLENRAVNAFVSLCLTRINGLVDITQLPCEELRLFCKIAVERSVHRHRRNNVCQLVLDCFAVQDWIELSRHTAVTGSLR